MDFIDRLKDVVNGIPDLPIHCKIGYLGAEESLVVYPLPGSKRVAEYMDGIHDDVLNYEFAVQSKNPQIINDTLWMIQDALEDLEELESQDGSFEFDSIEITGKPFINQIDDQGWTVFLLDVKAKITVFEGEK